MSRVYILKIILSCLLMIISGCIPALSSESLPESDHPYANNLEDKWPNIIRSNATQIRLHFKYIDLNYGDRLILYDGLGDQLISYPSGFITGIKKEDYWTDWYTTDRIVVELVTDNSETAQGFKIDNVETRTNYSLSDNLPESYHPYANNFEYKWPSIIRPNATKIRLHFKYIDLDSGDRLILYDGFGDQLISYPSGFTSGIKKENYWTDWYTTDRIVVELVTDNSKAAQGFKIDNVETSDAQINNVESNDVDSTDIESNDVEFNDVESNDVEPNYILTTTTLSSSANSSIDGQPVTFTAKVNTPSDEIEEPFGTITFMDGSTYLGTADVSSEQATLITSSLLVGSHSITAKYSGDVNFKSSTSSPFPLTVQEQPSTEGDSNIGQNVPTEQTDTESSKMDKEPIWENPIFSSLIAPVIVGIVMLMIKKRYFPQLRRNK